MTYAQANYANECLDRLVSHRAQRDGISGLTWASSTVGRWYQPGSEDIDYVSVSIVGEHVRCTDYEDGNRISSVDLTPDQWRHELAGMRMLGFVRA